MGGTLLLSVLYTLVAHKVYKSEVILEVTGINQDFMNSKEVDPTSNQVTGDEYIETQTKLLKSPPVVQRTAADHGSQGSRRHRGQAGHLRHHSRMGRRLPLQPPRQRAKPWS